MKKLLRIAFAIGIVFTIAYYAGLTQTIGQPAAIDTPAAPAAPTGVHCLPGSHPEGEICVVDTIPWWGWVLVVIAAIAIATFIASKTIFK